MTGRGREDRSSGDGVRMLFSRLRCRRGRSVPLPTPAPRPKSTAIATARRDPPHRPILLQPAAARQPGARAFSRSRSPCGKTAYRARPPPSTPISVRCSTRSAAICRACRPWWEISCRSARTAGASRARSTYKSRGKSASHYNPPSPIDIIADGSVGRGARSLAGNVGLLPAVADAAALSACRPHRSAARHRRGQRFGRRHVRHRGHRGNAAR